MGWTLHPAGDDQGPAILVVPGGAYRILAEHEGAPAAAWLNGLGIHAAVLDYPVGAPQWPAPLHAAREALTALRTGASGMPVDARRVGVMGFSAGGHLAGLLATDTADTPGADPSTHAGRPDLALLCYPVTDLRETLLGQENLHTASAVNLLGADAPADLRAALSLPIRIAGTPEPLPGVFCWTTSDDALVPALHTASLMASLAAAGATFEGHVLPHGRHGLGLATDDPDVGRWTDLAAQWLARHGWC